MMKVELYLDIHMYYFEMASDG